MPKGTTIPINAEYIREAIRVNGLKMADLSTELGYESAFLSNCLRRRQMLPSTIKFLSLLTGMDERQMKEIPKPKAVMSCDIPDAADNSTTHSAITESTELVISYIQDLGKINSDILRELREMRSMFKEYIDKRNREFHELDVYLRNSGAEARKSREAMNSTLSKTHNYLERKLEQQK